VILFAERVGRKEKKDRCRDDDCPLSPLALFRRHCRLGLDAVCPLPIQGPPPPDPSFPHHLLPFYV